MYEQIQTQSCELHDSPFRLDDVGVIEREVEWKESRSFVLRLHRKLVECNLKWKD